MEKFRAQLATVYTDAVRGASRKYEELMESARADMRVRQQEREADVKAKQKIELETETKVSRSVATADRKSMRNEQGRRGRDWGKSSRRR